MVTVSVTTSNSKLGHGEDRLCLSLGVLRSESGVAAATFCCSSCFSEFYSEIAIGT